MCRSPPARSARRRSARGGTAFQLGVQALGPAAPRPSNFGDIILKRDAEGGLTRLRDVARVELGAQDYSINAYLQRARRDRR